MPSPIPTPRNLSEAIRIQIEWSRLFEFDYPSIDRILCVDSSYSIDQKSMYTVLLGFNLEGERILKDELHSEVNFPYIPTLFCFREGPPQTRILEKYASEGDLIVVNGHGIAHPRRFGLATYIGVSLDSPTLGLAKKKIVGEYNGDYLVHMGEVVGRRVGGFLASVGHRFNLDDIEIIRLCTRLMRRTHNECRGGWK